MKQETILIVDDNVMNCKLLEIILRNEPYKLLFALNGKDAIVSCLSNPVSLVLMDYYMPVIDGIRTSERIKKFKPSVPIILQTSYIFDSSFENKLKSLFNTVLTRPVIPKYLIKTIRKLIYYEEGIAC